MNVEHVVNKVLDFIRTQMAGNDASHDVAHCLRVGKLAQEIARREKYDNPSVVVLAGLLHDVVDGKYVKEDDRSGVMEKVKGVLSEAGVVTKDVNTIVMCIESCGFRKQLARTTEEELPVALRCVQDADMLDAIGAIGIARCFTFGGARNRALYDISDIGDVSIQNTECISLDQYEKQHKEGSGCTINHFFEKLLHLKDMMQTCAGKQMAQERHSFMEQYLRQFFSEVSGEV